MPDVNHHSISELREHARHYITAVRTDSPDNLTHNAQMLANLVERLLDDDQPQLDFTSDELRYLAEIMDTNQEQRGFDFWSAVAAMAAEDRNADERKAVALIDGDERLASFAATCGSDDLEERLTDEIERNDLDMNVDNIDFVKVMNYFQNT